MIIFTTGHITTFYFTLEPRLQGTVSNTARGRALSKPDGVEILLVEDNPADAELTLHALHKHISLTASSMPVTGKKPWTSFLPRGLFGASRRGELGRTASFEAPKIDGLQVLREIKSDLTTKPIPVIVLTSSKEEREIVKSYQLGVNSYIQKPVNFTEFQDVVRQLGMYWLLLNAAPPVAAPLAR